LNVYLHKMEKTVSEAIAYRRSTRIYKDLPIDTEKVKQCLVNASLAPTSSNLQLWEFYHITNKEKIGTLAEMCFNQGAAKTAQQLVVIVARKDLWRKRANDVLSARNNTSSENSAEKELKYNKRNTKYFKTVIPILYSDFLGFFGWIKYFIFQIIGLFRPVYRQTRNSDLRVVAHKSAGLAAQNFMISMAAIGYDTCPMEGSDTLRVKKILGLPRGAEINMIIGCGIREEKGIHGPRIRVPFEDVYFEV